MISFTGSRKPTQGDKPMTNTTELDKAVEEMFSGACNEDERCTFRVDGESKCCLDFICKRRAKILLTNYRTALLEKVRGEIIEVMRWISYTKGDGLSFTDKTDHQLWRKKLSSARKQLLASWEKLSDVIAIIDEAKEEK